MSALRIGANMLRALRSRNYRLFFFGQLVSLVGTWTQRIAQAWLVYRLTGSAALLGLVTFASQIPVFFLAPLGGALADRRSKRGLLVFTQAASMVLAFVLAALTLSGVVRVEHVFVLAFLLGLVNALDTPTRQAFVVEMTGKADLMNAIALNSSVFNAARMIGPAVAGVLVAAIGEGWCFFVNGASYIAVIAGLLMMRGLAPPDARPRAAPLAEIAEGLRFVARRGAIRTLLLLLSAMAFFGMPYTVLMPLFAAQVFGGGARALGWLMSAAGVGALGGALALARREHLAGLGRWIAIAGVVFGAGLAGFALSRSMPLSLLLLIFVGFSMIVVTAACNTLIQSLAPDALRGRVMAAYSMVFMGATPLGALASGALAEHTGAPATVALGGVICIVVAVWFGRALPELRASARELFEQSRFAESKGSPEPVSRQRPAE